MTNALVDNVKLFTELTRDTKGNVDDIIFEKLIERFENYILFKKIYSGNNNHMKIKGARKDISNIKFRVEFESEKILSEFLEENEDNYITYKHTEYTPIFNKIGQQIIDIYFIKRK